jgi:hypothetical protein
MRILAAALMAFALAINFSSAASFLEQLAKPVVSAGGDVFDIDRNKLRSNIDALEKAATGRVDEAARALGGSLRNDTQAAKEAIENIGREARKGADNIARAGKKAFDDYVRTVKKAASDLVDAAKATGHYLEFQIKGFRHTLSDAERRVREGKVIDAVFHFYTDQWKIKSDGAFTAAEESELIKVAMSSAASTYGGPAGAAAFSAWYAYNKTGGDADAALRVGMLAGIQSYAIPAAADMPAGTAGEVAKKALVSGAIGGLAVAAAGGDSDAVRDAFIKQGGMVIVQAGQSYVTKQYDAATAQADSFCTSSLGVSCKPTLDVVVRDKDGSIIFDERGVPKVDNQKILETRKQLGTWGNSKIKATVPEIPNLAALSIAGDSWAVSWDRGILTSASANLPGVSLTYVGRGSPFERKVRELEALSGSNTDATSVSIGARELASAKSQESPAGWRWINWRSRNYQRIVPRGDRLFPFRVGDILRLTETAYLVDRPEGRLHRKLSSGTVVIVTETAPYVDCGVLPGQEPPPCFSPPPRQWFRIEALGKR